MGSIDTTPSSLPVTILIPAYNPPKDRFKALMQQLLQAAIHSVMVINDGSDPPWTPAFDALAQQGVVVLHHTYNMGKGTALQTGLSHWATHLQDQTVGVITMDADGQHLLQDALRIGQQLSARPDTLHLGARHFASHIPWRSYVGNQCMQRMFHLITKVHLKDTQTGLRGIPKALITPAASIQQKGYTYELEVLLLAIRMQVPIEEHPIQTIYLNRNASSHFRPVQDTAGILIHLLRYAIQHRSRTTKATDAP